MPRPDPEESRAERAEWAAGLLSALVVALMLGFLTWQAVRGTDALPDLSVEIIPAPPGAAGQLRFAVVNRGDRAASAVTLSLGLGDTDKRGVTIDFVPARSQVTGAFLLGPEERGLTPRLTVESYLDP